MDICFYSSGIEGCPPPPLDIAFAIDVSNSIWPDDFYREIAFFRKVTRHFSTSSYDARFAALTFGLAAEIKAFFDNNPKRKIPDLLESIQQPGGVGGSSTNILSALTLIRDKIFKTQNGARSDVVRLLILSTDARFDKVKEVFAAAKRLKDDGVFIAGYGAGRPYLAHLYDLISKPKRKFLYGSGAYTNLTSLEELIQETACKSKYGIKKNN